MRVRVAMAAALLSVAFAGAAAAGYWTGAGWYVVTANLTDDQPMIFTGPFATKEACEAKRPANADGVDYACTYLETQPDWDN